MCVACSATVRWGHQHKLAPACSHSQFWRICRSQRCLRGFFSLSPWGWEPSKTRFWLYSKPYFLDLLYIQLWRCLGSIFVSCFVAAERPAIFFFSSSQISFWLQSEQHLAPLGFSSAPLGASHMWLWLQRESYFSFCS